MRINIVLVLLFFSIKTLAAQEPIAGIAQPVVVKSVIPKSIKEDLKKQISEIIDREFMFQGLPEYIAGHVEKKFLEENGVKLMELLIKNYPDSRHYLEALYQVGNYYYDNKKYKKAILNFEKYLEINDRKERSKELYYKSAVSHKNLKMYKEAVNLFYKVLDTFGRSEYSYDAYQGIADCFKEQNDINKLIVTYENVTGYFEDVEIVTSNWFKIVEIYIEQKNYYEAIWILNRLVDRYETSKNYFEALYLLAACYGKSGDFEKEQKILNQIIKDHSITNKYGIKSLFSLGNSHYLNKNYKEASITYYSALKKDPRYPDRSNAMYKLGKSYLELNCPELALDVFNDLAEEPLGDEKKREILFHIGEIYLKQQNYSKAIEGLFKIVNQNNLEQSYSSKAIYCLGLCYFYQEKYRNAFEYFMYVEHNEEDDVLRSRSIYMLGKVLVKVSKFDSSTIYFNSAIEIADNFFQIRDTATEAEKENMEFNIKDEVMFAEIKKDSLFALANGYFEKNNFKESAVFYEKLVKINMGKPDRAWVLFHLGKCYENTRNFSRARDLYIQVRDTYPEQEVARQAEWNIKNMKWRKRYSKIKPGSKNEN